MMVIASNTKSLKKKGGDGGIKLKVDDSSDEEYYEPDEEELDEERQDAAAKLIQGLFRAKRARYIIRELVKANFIKEVDSLTGEYIYRNRRTGQLSRRKPVFLGSDDLETPRFFAPPDGYDPGKASLPQFALVITNRTFESPKIPDIPEQVEGDHTAIRETLQHPYFSKFQSENCFFAKNASLEIFKASLASLEAQVSATMSRLKKESERRAKALHKERDARALERRHARRARKREERVGSLSSDDETPETSPSEEEGEEEEDKEEEFDPQEALVLVYICTHAAEVTKGKGAVGTYLATYDTSWKSKEMLAKTAVPIETLAEAIAGIQVRHKVLFLDVVHTEREVGSFKTRHLYPPPNLYTRTANLAGAVVVGSCRIGATNELDLVALRKEAAGIWDAQPKEGHSGGDGGGMGGKGDGGGGDHSDTAGSDSRSSESGNGSNDSSSSSSSNVSDESTRGDDYGSTDDGDGSDSDVTGAGNSSSNARSVDSSASERAAGGKAKGIGNGRAESRSSDVSSDRRDRDRRRKNRSRKGTADDGDTRKKTRRGQASARSPANGHGTRARSGSWVRRGKNEASAAPPPSSSRLLGSLPGALRGNTPGFAGDGSGDGSEQATRPCVAVYDRAIYEEKMSVFGRAVRDALGGECTEKGHVHRVLLVDLFKFIRRELRPFERPRELVVMPATEERGESGDGEEDERGAAKKMRAAAAEAKAKKEAAKKEARRRSKPGQKARAEGLRQEKEAARLEEEEDELRRRTQVPVLAGPSILAIARATVCAAPSPPPPPTVPFPVQITRTTVRLTWEDPSFSGAPPLSYELEERGSLRNNQSWKPVFHPWYPTIVSHPVNIPHRVPGLGLRYRVRACNHGGSGDFSDATEVITTKPWLEDVGRNATARSIEALMRAGGPRLVLVRMRRYSASLLVQESGFHQLVAEFHKGKGIPRVSLAHEVASVVTDAMEAFSQVRTIQGSGLLLLGWAARGKGGGDSLPPNLVDRCLALVRAAEKLHSMDVTVKSHASWARSNLDMSKGGVMVAYRETSEDVWADTAVVDVQ